MAWTDDKIETLKRMWDEQHTASTIAAAIGGGYTRNAVIAKAHRLGLGARPQPIDFDAPFERVCDRVIDAPFGAYTTIIEAAQAEGMNPTVATRMWSERIVSTHGGDPR